MQMVESRRRFLTSLTAAGAVGLVGSSTPSWAEPPPETTTVRLPVFYKISDCQLPEYISTDLLRAEGFTDIQFIASGTGPDSTDWLVHDEIDFDFPFLPAAIRSIDSGAPIKVLAGMHSGCLELISDKSIRSVMDLKGRRVGIDVTNGTPHELLIIMAAYVGLDPVNDINWIANPDLSPLELLAEGKIDAFLGIPPLPQEARDRKLGHVILNTSTDDPWSQYHCCMLTCTADYVSRYPAATKRVLRALLKAVDLCVSDPEQVARLAVERGFAGRYDYALQAMSDGRYNTWRDYDVEDSMRFYALRMQETGIAAASPQKIIADGTDLSFLNELKRELKT